MEIKNKENHIRTYICDGCGFKTRGYRTFSKHRHSCSELFFDPKTKKFSLKKGNKCDWCLKEFKTLNSLKIHKNTCKSNPNYDFEKAKERSEIQKKRCNQKRMLVGGQMEKRM